MYNKFVPKKDGLGVFMPFGSMCNAFAQIYQGTGKDVDTKWFGKCMDEIYKKAVEMVEKEETRMAEKNEVKVVPTPTQKSFVPDPEIEI